ncbi:Holliday junction branch migration protein RuvA [Psychroflexus sp. ALD_RP9]|uniref:Holliday junction branch migration protein RuvA n=1 Tax=Psychroflexus sp. ALD_RP9 TaxID=2777186 RepID=UPI001A9024F2|nr:Holliday junction branch migration protein RuvA [Psychroflexus sp. ALD_RP9]QSS96150.1 Holliday junction branch migration protein RuvA [Psychroflexus sp. ALD_RP9]
MITQIIGKLVEKNPTHLVIDCNGVGYEVNVSLHTFSQIKDEELIRLYTHLHVKEDAHTLYGFAEKSEREVFRKLISVSGIGTSTARIMLSSLSPNQVVEAILNEDAETIQSVKGIGKKTAQRVILDLKDKLDKTEEIDVISTPNHNSNKKEALSALETLGYNRKVSEKVVTTILANEPSSSVENIIKLALKKL